MTNPNEAIETLQADIEQMKMLKALAQSEGETSENIHYDHDLYITDAESELLELQYKAA